MTDFVHTNCRIAPGPLFSWHTIKMAPPSHLAEYLITSLVGQACEVQVREAGPSLFVARPPPPRSSGLLPPPPGRSWPGSLLTGKAAARSGGTVPESVDRLDKPSRPDGTVVVRLGGPRSTPTKPLRSPPGRRPRVERPQLAGPPQRRPEAASRARATFRSGRSRPAGRGRIRSRQGLVRCPGLLHLLLRPRAPKERGRTGV